MKHKDLKRELRKKNILKLVLPAAVLIAAAALLIFNPVGKSVRAVTINSLADIAESYSSGRRYIQYAADGLYYSGVDYRVGGRTRAKVYYTLDGGQCYFFIISADRLPKDTGIPVSINVSARLIHNESMYRRIIASLSDSLSFAPQGLESVCSETLISQYDLAHSFPAYYTAALVILCAVCGLFTIARLLTVIFPSLSMPVYRLRRYGSKAGLFAEAREEFKNAPPPKIPGLYLTERFMIHLTRTSADIIPLENITWIYTSNELRRFHGSPRIYAALCILTETRKTYRVRHVSNKAAADIISELQTKFPSIMSES